MRRRQGYTNALGGGGVGGNIWPQVVDEAKEKTSAEMAANHFQYWYELEITPGYGYLLGRQRWSAENEAFWRGVGGSENFRFLRFARLGTRRVLHTPPSKNIQKILPSDHGNINFESIPREIAPRGIARNGHISRITASQRTHVGHRPASDTPHLWRRLLSWF